MQIPTDWSVNYIKVLLYRYKVIAFPTAFLTWKEGKTFPTNTTEVSSSKYLSSYPW